MNKLMKSLIAAFITLRILVVFLVVLVAIILIALIFFPQALPALGIVFVFAALTSGITFLTLKRLWGIVEVRGGLKETWVSSDGVLVKDIRYGKARVNSFDLYLPAGADLAKPQHVMLFIHGGAWASGKKADMAYAAKRYAKEGYITATMGYTLAAKNKPQVTFATMIDEITACIAKIKAELDGRGYQVNKIALSGTSAGAHLSMLYAFAHADKSPIPVAFVFQQVGPVAFYPEFWLDMKHTLAFATIGTGTKINPEMIASGKADSLLRSISPLYHITPKTVPTLFAYGGKDTTVIPLHGKKLKEALEQNKVPHLWIDYPNSTHVLAEDPDVPLKYHQAVKQFARDYFHSPADH